MKIGNNRINSYVLVGVIIGLVFIILSWTLEFLVNDISFSLRGIKNIHKNIILYIVDSAPVVLGVISYLLSKIIQKKEESLNKIIQKNKQEVKELSEFTEQIGKGNFQVKVSEALSNTELGKALMEMKKHLEEKKDEETAIKWIKDGRDLIAKVLRRNTDLQLIGDEIVKELCQYIGVEQGAFYVYEEDNDIIRNYGTYAYSRKKYLNQEFKIGYGLIGQAAFEKDTIYRTEIPDDYTTFTSGLIRDKKPTAILIEPLIYNDKLEGVLEMASVHEFSKRTRHFIKEVASIISETLFNLKVNYTTKKLLEASRKMTERLQENEEELRQNAEEMRATHEELEKTNKKLAIQIKEVETYKKKLELLLENASEVISIFDKNQNIIYESPSSEKILGYKAEKYIGKNGISSLDKGTQQQFIAAFKALKNRNGEKKEIKFQYIRKSDRKKIWLHTTIRNLLDTQGINGFLLNTRDITMEIIAKEEQRKRGQMQALSENSPDMIARISKKGIFFYSNPSFQKFFNINANEVLNKSIEQIPINKDFKEFLTSTLNRVNKIKRKISTEASFIVQDKQYFLNINIIPEFEVNNKEITTYLTVFHDITTRKLFEQEIEQKNKKITESINYAYRIQKAILPDNQFIKNIFEKSFIFYKPKDVISGDFPWIFQKGNNIFVAAVDCTGHGVPGALLSFIGYFHLNNIVDHDREIKAGEVLDLLHQKVKKTLRQDIESSTTRDGMDVGLVKINLHSKKIEFAGAHRALYMNRGNEIIEYKGERKAIGGISHRQKFEKSFTTHTIAIQEKDRIFIFSDGLPDQIGGLDRVKYKNKRIKEIILKNKKAEMFQIGNIFIQDFNNWKGDEKQIDDILLIGIEF